jgi:group I intron endonuclease
MIPPNQKRPGVYMVLNVITNGRYVGSAATETIRQRWGSHRYRLKSHKACGKDMQNAYDTYGIDSFRIIVLENTAPEDAKAREQYWLDHFKELGLEVYNRCPRTTDNAGLVYTEEARAKQRRPRTKPVSAETRAKLSAAKKGTHRPDTSELFCKDWPAIRLPDGSATGPIHNLLAFCKEHGLDESAMRKVLLSQRPSHHGYRKA